MDIYEDNIPSVQYTDEQLYQQKIATENGLIAIGIALAKKQEEIKDFEKLKKKLSDIVIDIKADPENDHIVADIIVKYMKFADKEINYYKQKVENLDEEYQTLSDESDEFIKQLENYENKEHNYWIPKINKINNEIKYLNNMIYRREKMIEFFIVTLLAMYLYIIYMIKFECYNSYNI